MGGGQNAPTIIRMAAPVGGAGGGQILRTIGGQQVVRVRAPAPTLASGQQIKVVGSSGQIIKSTTVSAAQAAQGKVETILIGCLNSIPSPSPSVKIQISGGQVMGSNPGYLLKLFLLYLGRLEQLKLLCF